MRYDCINCLKTYWENESTAEFSDTFCSQECEYTWDEFWFILFKGGVLL